MAITVARRRRRRRAAARCYQPDLPKLQQIRDSLQRPIVSEAGGAFEESAKGNASIFVLFPLMVIVMLTLLMMQLQSFSRLLLCS